MPTLAQWNQLWTCFNIAAPDAAVYDKLMAAYSEPHRKCHTLQHLDECLAKFSELRSEAQFPTEVELALWFHDAIYDPQRQHNETKSAEWACAVARAANLLADVEERIHRLVMVTRHDAAPKSPDEKILVDIDLSILGTAAERFDEYETQIREEYAWVPGLIFRTKRRKILQGFLSRTSIFNTSNFIEAYEARARARANLQRSLQRLGA